MDNGVWVLIVTPIIVAYIYWDYKRVQKMIVPPPPKPAPLVEPMNLTKKEPTPEQMERYNRRIQAEIDNRPTNQMTRHEWAQIREMIANSNLKMVGEIWMSIATFVSIFLAAVRPEWWWVYIAIVVFWYRQTTKPYEEAAAKATKYREDSEGKHW